MFYRIFYGIGVLFQLFVFQRFFFDLVGELGDREAGVNAAAVLLQRVVNKLVLLLKTSFQVFTDKEYTKAFFVRYYVRFYAITYAGFPEVDTGRCFSKDYTACTVL